MIKEILSIIIGMALAIVGYFFGGRRTKTKVLEKTVEQALELKKEEYKNEADSVEEIKNRIRKRRGYKTK